MRYRAFRTKKDNQFNFQFKTDGDDVVLKSQPYASKDDCFNGIRSVIKNADNPDRYKSVAGEQDGTFAFIITAGNNQEIARSVDFDSEEAANEMIALCQKEIPPLGKKDGDGEKTRSAKTTESGYEANKRGDDDYRPLAFYEENISGVDNGFDTCTDADEWYFTYNMNSQVILISEGYNSDKGRDNGIASVTKNMTIPERYKKAVHSNGKHYFNLKAGNHQEIATSRWFDTEVEADLYIKALIANDPSLVAPKMAAAMANTGTSGHAQDEYLNCDAYNGEAGFHSFEHEGEFYFSYNNADGKTILRSQGYTAASGRDNGIKSVKKNGPIHKRWTTVEEGGKWYFALKAGNHQEIARSCPFDSEDAMKSAYVDAQYAFEDKAEGRPEKVAAMAATGHELDDYLDCAAYTGAIGFHIFDKDGEYYFGYNNANGDTILRSQGYTAEAGRDNGIESVKKNAKIHERWTTAEEGGKWYYALKAGNHQEIARSCPFDSENDMKSAYVDARYEFEDKPEKVAAMAPTGHILDDYLSCGSYAGAAGFHKFEKDGEFYFGYNNADGKTILRSQGYTAESGRDNGIESVKKNAKLHERWTTKDVDGKWFYSLKAGNHQEIAISCPFDSEGAMKSAYVDARYEFEDKPEPVVAKAMAPAADKIVDDYLPCEAYSGAEGFYSFYDENRKEYFFAYNDKDGNTLLRSEGYTTAAARDNGIESVKKNAPIEKRWKKETALNGKYHYYVLKAGNHQEIARSCYYEDSEKMSTNFLLAGGAFATLATGGSKVVSSITTSSSSSSSSSSSVKSTPPPVKKEKEDDYLPCKEYEGRHVNDKENNVALFKHDNGQYYFAMYRADGSVRLRSEGFETAKGRDQELSGVLKYSDSKDMYSRIKRGEYFIEVLKDKTGREVGRSCLQKVAPPVPPKPKEKEDDYLKCSEYTNRKVNDKVNNVALFRHENGQYYFAIYNSDGSVRLRSEGFGTAKGRDQELSGALKNLNNEKMYETIQKGSYYINVLKDSTGREVGRSCMKKERVPFIPIVGSGSAVAGGGLVAGGIASSFASGGGGGMIERKESELKEKIVVPPPVVKPAAPAAKSFSAPPPPPKKVKVVAAAPIVKEEKDKGGFAWWWLLPLFLLLALLALLLRGCDGCAKTPPVVPPVIVDTVKAETPPPAPVKTAICPAAGDLKLAEGTGSNVANYLSDPESNYPKRFTFDNVSFGRNGARLKSAGKKALDDLAVCLKSCPNTSVDIYGYITGNENSSYRGSKEVSLDDVRARTVYEYLQKRGIDGSRMSFQGEGTGDSSNITIRIDEK
ncbi:MAG: DUF1508 domain-containing protein [Saprospiraceae bacterium]